MTVGAVGAAPLEIILNYPWPWLAFILPVIGALLMPVLGRINHKLRDYGAVFFAFLAVIMAAAMIPSMFSGHPPGDIRLMTWFNFPGGAPLEIGVLVDPLSIIIANVVAFISFLIVIYSTEYMKGDPNLDRFWFFFLFFIGNMLLLVLSDNLFQTLIGWEGVGLCSYGLIGYFYRDPKDKWLGGPPPTKMVPPSHAGMKAFVVTGIGDVFLLASIFIIFHFAGTVNYMDLIRTSETWLGQMAAVPGLIALTAILFLGGPIGKSAQFPLHEWLPEAMAGPTPVSALIHAATMVKAGVYLVARVSPIFFLGYWSFGFAEAQTFFWAIALVGAFTAFLAASQALVALELKKILAYSTVSQIGYMMLALGLSGLSEGGFLLGMTAGIFHLMSHALFKAALFLCAGSVIHALENIYITNMGGLKKWMPITHGLMLLAALSLSGIPPFSGFFSKDAVFVSALVAAQEAPFAMVLLVVGAISAMLTFFYSLRMMSLTFYGEPSEHIQEMERHGHHVHEMKPTMWVTYGILVGLMIIIGLLGLVGLFVPSLSPEVFIETQFEHMLEGMFEGLNVVLRPAHVEWSTKIYAMSLSAVMLAIGGILGWVFYVGRKVDPGDVLRDSPTLKRVHTFLWNRWYMNPLYYAVFVDGILALKQRIFDGFESRVMFRLGDIVAKATVAISGVLYGGVEVSIMEGTINTGVPSAVTALYHKVKKLQTGLLSYNIIYMVVLLVVIIIGLVLWG